MVMGRKRVWPWSIRLLWPQPEWWTKEFVDMMSSRIYELKMLQLDCDDLVMSLGSYREEMTRES